MDLNYLLTRHQTSLMRAARAAFLASRNAHRGLAAGYAGQVVAIQHASGATFPLLYTDRNGEVAK